MAENLFHGAMPAFYDRYLGPIAFAPYATEMAARVKALAPRRVLEIRLRHRHRHVCHA